MDLFGLVGLLVVGTSGSSKRRGHAALLLVTRAVLSNCLTISNRPGTASPVKGKLQQHLTPLPEALLLAVPMLLGAACAAIQRDTEQMLVAAGFHMRPTDTTELQEDLRSIPPHRLVSRTKEGNVVYMYADPDNCHCVYVGGSKEYSEYERRRLERELKPPAGAAGGAP